MTLVSKMPGIGFTCCTKSSAVFTRRTTVNSSVTKRSAGVWRNGCSKVDAGRWMMPGVRRTERREELL